MSITFVDYDDDDSPRTLTGVLIHHMLEVKMGMGALARWVAKR